jgi:eukaryotic-like serine/threonine-protein kinase
VSAPVERLSAALSDRYRIERELGAGGMATVYLAHDIKHERDVAIKVLHPDLGAALGADRFLSEIKTTAKLQHPHILPLLDSGAADGQLYYVMPVVTGETLRARLERERQLPIAEAVRIAREVASALDYAHRQGVIHRDIKPENILLHDGQAIVADFGIALAVQQAGGARMTQTGLSLGTPQYMSPEQAMGEKTIDARSDIYSLGAVAYEMLAGDAPFTGGSVQAIVAKVLSERPTSLHTLRDTVPEGVESAVLTALAKLPADRFATAAEFGAAIGDGVSSGARMRVSPGNARALARARRMNVGMAGAVILALLAAASAWLRPATEQPVVRLDLSMGDITPLRNQDVIISPDGSTIAVAGDLGGEFAIYIRRLDGPTEFQKVPGTDDGIFPAFSPDSRWIVFRRTRDSSLVKVSVSIGAAMTLVRSGEINPFFSEWFEHEIIAAGPSGRYRIPDDGGTAVPLKTVQSRTHSMLPDGSGLLIWNDAGVLVHDFASDSATLLIPDASHATYVGTGHLLYVGQDDALFAVPFDPKRRKIRGPPVRIVDQVARGNVASGYSVAKNGTLLVMVGRGVRSATRLLIAGFDRTVDSLHLPRAVRLLPRFSPDGRYIAFEAWRAPSTETDIFTFNLMTGTIAQLTTSGDNDDPVWSPDSRRILFNKLTSESGEDLYVRPADNSAAETPVLRMPGSQQPTAWLRDGTILFTSMKAGRNIDLLMLRPGVDSTPKVYLDAPWREDAVQVSPDGKLSTYETEESGTREVWMREFPDPKGKWRITPSGATGSSPRWSPDGKYIFYWREGVSLDTLLRVRIDQASGITVRAPEVMATMDLQSTDNWDLHPDGRHFIVAVEDVPTTASGLPASPIRHHIVLNWFTELRRLSAQAAK